MLRSTLMIGQGLLKQLGVLVLTLAPYKGTPLSHWGRMGGSARLLAVIVPPAVPPAALMMAPVGTLERPKALLKARSDSQLIVSYIMVAPPRRTVFPLPVTSQAKPRRGAKFLWSGL